RWGLAQGLAREDRPRPRANLVEADDEIDLPGDVAGVGRNELADDRQAVLVVRERARPIIGCDADVADPDQDHVDVALPGRVAQIEGGNLAPDRMAFLGGRGR